MCKFGWINFKEFSLLSQFGNLGICQCRFLDFCRLHWRLERFLRLENYHKIEHSCECLQLAVLQHALL